jgi:hypothetical protein
MTTARVAFQRPLRIIASFGRWYWHQVCRVPRDLFFFALGATYVSVLLQSPYLMKMAVERLF